LVVGLGLRLIGRGGFVFTLGMVGSFQIGTRVPF
jgi:hypothetical protein